MYLYVQVVLCLWAFCVYVLCNRTYFVVNHYFGLQTTDPMDQGSSGVFFTIGGAGGGKRGHYNHIKYRML